VIKNSYVGHICEAYYEKDRTWYAALIQDINEKN
jgi:hypothetical protein